MKLLEKKRNAVLAKCAKHIQAECEAWADWPKLSNREQDETFEGYESCVLFGFDAAIKELEPVLKELVEAITAAAEYHNTDDVNGEAGYIAWKALQKYKQLTGGK